ncbi:outer membrane beta-barrel protein [Phenylobacterium montanum]|uniref:Outer membrane beta-barrel protein n=1 Tax=Phenylobacterium montanum TaxID=2823693 RepID=A0A975G2R0_9CAUL|nr:outer membrane beta-barrel protein [Caulobacter sp. S6]QUD90058.1 outer membrane beta-barrel protein [Caulobacter sp. S6]
MTLQKKALGAASALALIMAAGAAWADDQPAAAPAAPAAAAAPPASWASTIKWSGHVEFGLTSNPDSPSNGLNYGQLFTDRANQFLLNSVALNVERDVDTSSKTLDVGFKVQAAYGSDSRYTQLIGEFNRSINSRNQFDIVEAHVDAHAPWLTAGGMELHAGILPTLEGVEVMDPTGNFFYSKSYLFNFGIPLKYTGVMTETHVSPLLDVYAGLDSGVNTFLGTGGGGNDGKVHFHGGFGLNFKNVTVLATTQIGAEDYAYDASGKVTGTNKMRYLNDAVITWKVNDKLTSTTDVNYIYDDLLKASGGGVTEYLTYPISSTVTLGGRAEIWRDDKNFYTAGFPGKFDFINFEGGYGPSSPVFLSASNATFFEFTVGINYKPAGLPKMIDGLTFRPELRYDELLTHGFAYDNGTKSHQTTIAFDIVAPFTL